MAQPFTPQLLKNEIVTDPVALGYKTAPGVWKEDGDIASIINLVRNAIGAFTFKVSRPDISPSEILEAIALADFKSTNNSMQIAWFQSVMSQNSIRLQNDDLTDTTVLANLKLLISSPSNSATRLGNILNRQGSRAEVLFGYNWQVQPNDVAAARSIGLT
jgi:hypothetical protein